MIKHGTLQQRRPLVVRCLQALTQGRRRAMNSIGGDAQDVLLTAMQTFQDIYVAFGCLCALAHITQGKGLSSYAAKEIVAVMKLRHANVEVVRAACRVLCYHVGSPRGMNATPNVTFQVAEAMTRRPHDDSIQWFGGRALLTIHALLDRVSIFYGSLMAQTMSESILATAIGSSYVCVKVRGVPWTELVKPSRLRPLK